MLAVWEAGFLGDAQVTDWAGRVLTTLRAANIPTWLLDLVQRGPAHCRDLPGFEWPARLDYASEFCLRAVALDLASDASVVKFAEWASVSCIGEDLACPEVRFGYYLDHLIEDCRRMDLAVAHVREEIPRMLDGCRERAARLLDVRA